MTRILRIDASMRRDGSVTRDLTDGVIARLRDLGAAEVTTRDLADGIGLIDETWIGANFTDPEQRTADQRTRLAASDELVDEIRKADVLVIGAPVYNFGIPAALKAWIDQVARARETFRYTENGAVGLLDGKRAIVVVASGGTGVDTEIDFATPYLRHVLGFIGIHDVEVISADRQMIDDAAVRSARTEIENLAA